MDLTETVVSTYVPPASRTATVTSGFSVNLAATARPAVPPPTVELVQREQTRQFVSGYD